MSKAAPRAQVADPWKRDFLKKVGLAGAAALGAGVLLKGLPGNPQASASPADDSWTLDSAFKPRADQLKRVLGRK